MRRALALLAVASLAGAAHPGGEAGRKELEKFQGTWRYVKFQMDADLMPAEHLKKLAVTFTGDRFVVREDGKVTAAGTQKLDPSQTPHAVDSFPTEGEGKGKKLL